MVNKFTKLLFCSRRFNITLYDFLVVTVVAIIYFINNSIFNTVFTHGFLIVFFSYLIKKVLMYFLKQYSSFIEKIHIFFLVGYFYFIGQYIGIFACGVAYCFPNFSFSAKNENSSTHTARDSSSINAHPKGDGAVLGQGSQVFSNVETGPGGNSLVYNAQDVGSNVIAGGALAMGLAMVTTLPTPATKVIGLGMSCMSSVAIANNGAATKNMQDMFAELSPAISKAVQEAMDKNIYPTPWQNPGPNVWEGPNTGLESSAIEAFISKLKAYVQPLHIVNSPTADFAFYTSILVVLIIFINIYVLFSLAFRDPLVEKLVKKLANYGKIGYYLSKFAFLTTTYNRYVCIIFLCYSTFLAITIIYFLATIGKLHFPLFN